MKRGSTGVVVGIILAVVLVIVVIGFFAFRGGDSSQLQLPQHEDFIAEISINADDILTDCFSDDHCTIERISGDFTNKGDVNIKGVFINYILLDKSSNEILFRKLDVSPRLYTYGLNLNLKKDEKEIFASESVFLTERVPKGDYLLRVELINVLSDEAITSTEASLKMQSAKEQILAELS
jgi:hypothetical protein